MSEGNLDKERNESRRTHQGVDAHKTDAAQFNQISVRAMEVFQGLLRISPQLSLKWRPQSPKRICAVRG
jgi:hypothetical protein